MSQTYIPLATTTLGSDQADVTFSTISGSYTDLILLANVISTQSGSGAGQLRMQFNGDTGSNYSFTALFGYGDGTTGSYRRSNYSYLEGFLYRQTSSSAYAYNMLHIMNYSNSTTYKTAISRSAGFDVEVNTQVSLWRSTNAITSIKIYPATGSIKTGSSLTLWGIKAE